MSDSSSVDRWHPSNVEWPKGHECPPGPRFHAPLYGEVEMLPADAYEALYADRGRVLAAARELADAVENFGGADTLEEATDAYDLKVMLALASFREVDHG